MKNILNFNEWLNESRLNEKRLGGVAEINLNSMVNMLIDNNWESDKKNVDKLLKGDLESCDFISSQDNKLMVKIVIKDVPTAEIYKNDKLVSKENEEIETARRLAELVRDYLKADLLDKGGRDIRRKY